MINGEGFQPIGDILPVVLKEVSLRVELRGRVEAEKGSSVSDKEFLEIAERDGVNL